MTDQKAMNCERHCIRKVIVISVVVSITGVFGSPTASRYDDMCHTQSFSNILIK